MVDQMALLRKEKRAMTMLEWMKEAKDFAEENLDEKPLQKLQKSSRQNEVYRSVATAGKATYLRELDRIEQEKPSGMDELIAMETAADVKSEAMLAALTEKMEELFPGYSQLYL